MDIATTLYENLESIGYIIALAILIYLSGRFSGSETALTAISKVDISKMKRNEEKNAKTIEYLKQHMDKTIITILIGNNLVNVSASAIATKLSYDLLGNIGVSIAVGAVTIFLLIFGEITPKGFALKNKIHFSKKNAKMIYYLSILMSPLIKVLSKISDKMINLFGGQTKLDNLLVTESDMRHLASQMESEGIIKEIEKDILHRVFWFGDLKVASVKVSKENTFALDSELDIDEAIDFVKEHGFTRLPVTKHDTDDIAGILYSKELLGKESGELEDFIREPYFVTNEDDITDIFQRMRKNRIHMAIVRDDNGDFDGIITLEDMMEELVGEIYDEYD
ncbi:MAG: hemolysin family protein [Thermoplasmatota archaeon]